MSQPINENKLCEKCEWCIISDNEMKCLLNPKECYFKKVCDSFKEKTGNHFNT